MKLDFIICGVQKSGTTSLQHYLSKHSQINLSENQEVHFFDDSEQFKQGKALFFSGFSLKKDVLNGQTSSTYIYDYVPKRMVEYVPEAKLIFILRNPTQRAYSHYLHACSKYREPYSFEKALQIENDRISKDFFHLRNYSYFNTGLYSKMIQSFLEFYPKQKMHFIILEELTQNPDKELNAVFKFLDIEPTVIDTSSVYNKTKLSKNKIIGKIFNNNLTRTNRLFYPLYLFHKHFLTKDYPKMNTETRLLLNKKYSSEITKIENLLNKKLNIWQDNS